MQLGGSGWGSVLCPQGKMEPRWPKPRGAMVHFGARFCLRLPRWRESWRKDKPAQQIVAARPAQSTHRKAAAMRLPGLLSMLDCEHALPSQFDRKNRIVACAQHPLALAHAQDHRTNHPLLRNARSTYQHLELGRLAESGAHVVGLVAGMELHARPGADGPNQR